MELKTEISESYYSFDFKRAADDVLQGVITTDPNMNILTVNDAECRLLGCTEEQLKGQKVLGLFAESSKADVIELSNNIDHVMGNVVQLTAFDGQQISCSLWLRKKQLEGRTFHIWIFQQIQEMCATLTISDGRCSEARGDFANIFGYPAAEVPGCAQDLVPSLPQLSPLMCIAGFYTGVSKSSEYFPLLVRSSPCCAAPNDIKLIVSCIPHISGLIVVRPNGKIYSINNTFSNHLFGIPSSSAIDKFLVTDLIPKFYETFQPSTIQTLECSWTSICRICAQYPKANAKNLTRSPKYSSQHSRFPEELLFEASGEDLKARHRDGHFLSVRVNVRSTVAEGEQFFILWVSYSYEDQVVVQKKEPEHVTLEQPLQVGVPSQIVGVLDQYLASLAPYQQTGTIKDYTILKDLGQGSYGYVKLAVNNKDPLAEKVVIKYVIKNKILNWCKRPDLGGRVPVEQQVLYDIRKAPHPSIPLLITSFQDSFFTYLLMPYEPMIDLFDYVEGHISISEPELKKIFSQDENVLINETSLAVKLIDFGSAQKIEMGPFSTFYGTLCFAPPEVLQGKSYEGVSQDMWGLGILLYTLVYGESPFFNPDQIMTTSLVFDEVSPCSDILQGLLARDPDRRWTMDMVLASDWLNSRLSEYNL